MPDMPQCPGGPPSSRKIAQHIQAARVGEPQVTFAVLEHLIYVVAGQTVCTSKMIDVATVDSVDAVITRSNPEIALAIDQKGSNLQGFSV